MRSEDVAVLESFTYGMLVQDTHDSLHRLRQSYQDSSDEGSVPPDFPTHIQIQTIGGCNASCPMCPMSVRDIRAYQKGRMSDELFEQVITEAASEPLCKSISPYLQNEPLLDENLATKIRFIKQQSDGRLVVRIVTNGSLLDDRTADELIDAGLDVISISLNAHTHQTYNEVMPGLDFDVTVRNINRLIDRKPSTLFLILTFMVTSQNENELEEAIEYWSNRGVMCGAWGVGTMAGAVKGFSKVRSSKYRSRKKECFVPLETATILANGEMLLCCTDWNRSSLFGNVAMSSVRDIWHSHELSCIRRAAIKQDFPHKACRKCLGQTKVPQNLLLDGGPGRNQGECGE